MSEALHIGLDAWIIQDGNYGDFRRGQKRAFALEFYPTPSMKVRHVDAPLAKSMTWRTGNLYAVQGEVSFAAPGWWVIDVGVELYVNNAPAPCAAGGQVAGEIHVLIDHFAYFERLAREADAPALIHDWRIDRVQLETTPWVEPRPRFFERDRSREGWRDVPASNAWQHDGGHGAYILTCTRLSEAGRTSL